MVSSHPPINRQTSLLFNARNASKLTLPGFAPYYSTELGDAYVADSCVLLKALPPASVQTVVTSPPYALHFKKEYGNATKQDYVSWCNRSGCDNGITPPLATSERLQEAAKGLLLHAEPLHTLR